MFTKLTLRLEKNVIEDAKSWADENQVSLSQLVSMLFKSLGRQSKPAADLTPWTRKLMGIAKQKGKKPPTDEKLKESYVDYLEEKYK